MAFSGASDRFLLCWTGANVPALSTFSYCIAGLTTLPIDTPWPGLLCQLLVLYSALLLLYLRPGHLAVANCPYLTLSYPPVYRLRLPQQLLLHTPLLNPFLIHDYCTTDTFHLDFSPPCSCSSVSSFYASLRLTSYKVRQKRPDRLPLYSSDLHTHPAIEHHLAFASLLLCC